MVEMNHALLSMTRQDTIRPKLSQNCFAVRSVTCTGVPTTDAMGRASLVDTGVACAAIYGLGVIAVAWSIVGTVALPSSTAVPSAFVVK
jgi:hypothetical protein